ncbi:leucine-rich repeat receptor protein kinase HPCA1-like isoform X1 [Zingiber officinale]|uniref:leucine-rich repeat receptor protein kinase HPCA1-like isoform X1 n=2 Tax=Zingiber officinale TaxID=94328 RepID=UPI001C4BF827|nr:leucine-rich repeat receptor protein kinase HPCA1-like isoform X1 [Zingiber officinale]XP_042427560.1 leucine-rich repeat receptor protein kinase HPCA1-like isoform X1 [Zingiber officinale]XP_042427561.1 leucine-rich repeat receptor protein kinase HPCA1-like isoform X1 [Zingiber officinale]
MGTCLLFLILSCVLHVGSGVTDPQDAAVLRSILQDWQDAPPSWGQSDDPCGMPWDGVVCQNSRVTSLSLSTMGIKGTLSGDIGLLSALQFLTLSYNGDLGGSLSPNIGNLKQLTTLILAGCQFSGPIPEQLGNLAQLTFLALNNNRFSGSIPASLGLLSNLSWFDIAENQLTGSLPVSTNSTPGLDLLVHTKHFHFNKNQLSGVLPPQLFSSEMTLLHLLFDSNQFDGSIPSTLGLVTSLEVLRLDNNKFEGAVPSNINNLTRVSELNLANNQLSGMLPNLTGMNLLHYVDLSNNSFSPSEAPEWFTTIESLTTLVIESGGLIGQVPADLFSLPQLQQVLLSYNGFNGTLNMSNNISPQLQLVDFRNNSITGFVQTGNYLNILILYQNPYCNSVRTSTDPSCNLQQQDPYSTSLSKCGSVTCASQDQKVNPQSCSCAFPDQGRMIFRGPSFRDLTNSTLFQLLETSLWTNLGLTPGYVYISNLHFNLNDYLELDLALFPSSGMFFNRSEISRIGFDLSNQTYKPPPTFGPYYFLGSPYPFSGESGTGGGKSSTGVIVGVAVGCVILVVGLVCVGVYALLQKKKAKRALEQSRPFVTWGSGGKDDGSAPQLKGARWFPFDEIKKITNNFSEANEIGSGGYGKVYRAILTDGQIIAIKRAQQGSMQGAHEFKTEIELLSRVHHKNLVDLVGFCFEKGEQMLVYEYIPNGTLRENLSGSLGIRLDWKNRLRIALGSARGLAYLHELANPPIIHRDVKSPNILLDENLNAKVADFGLSKLVSDSEKGHVSTQVKGTLGYLDPEYYMTQQLSEKSDVYSFGVVMLELITGRQPIEKGKYIVREVRTAIDGRDQEYYGLKNMVDPVLRNMGHIIGFRRFVELAMRCLEETAANRPTMNQIVKEIETIIHTYGLNTQPNSASSSATEFGDTQGAPRHHPYNGHLHKNEESSDFQYSGAYSAVIEPK